MSLLMVSKGERERERESKECVLLSNCCCELWLMRGLAFKYNLSVYERERGRERERDSNEWGK